MSLGMSRGKFLHLFMVDIVIVIVVVIVVAIVYRKVVTVNLTTQACLN